MSCSPVLFGGQPANSESVVCDDRGGSPSSLASAYWLRSGPHSPSVSFIRVERSLFCLSRSSLLKWSETTSDSFFYSVSHAEIPYIPRTPALFRRQGLQACKQAVEGNVDFSVIFFGLWCVAALVKGIGQLWNSAYCTKLQTKRVRFCRRELGGMRD